MSISLTCIMAQGWVKNLTNKKKSVTLISQYWKHIYHKHLVLQQEVHHKIAFPNESFFSPASLPIPHRILPQKAFWSFSSEKEKNNRNKILFKLEAKQMQLQFSIWIKFKSHSNISRVAEGSGYVGQRKTFSEVEPLCSPRAWRQREHFEGRGMVLLSPITLSSW